MSLYGNEVEALKVGDEVATSSGYRYGRIRFSFTKVVKITQTGQVRLENGLRFNKGGRQIGAGSGLYSMRMWNADEARERQAEGERQAAMEQKFAEITEKLKHAISKNGGMYMDDKAEDRKQLANDLRVIADEIENF